MTSVTFDAFLRSLPGRTVGTLRIDGPLGEGGMGVVFLAFDTVLERPVCLKFLRTPDPVDPDLKERFAREARIAASLDHPGIATLHAGLEIDGHLGYVMERVEGSSWEALLGPGPGAAGRGAHLSIALHVIDALEHAWSRHRVVHRDIKPDNVMVTPAGTAKLLDFGLAKSIRPVSGVSLTAPGMIMGTPHYMSPEQIRDRDLDFRTDIYSLGIVLFRAMTGRLPFDGDPPISILFKHLEEDPPAPRDLDPTLDEGLSLVIARMIEKVPERRYESHARLREALAACLGALPAAAGTGAGSAGCGVDAPAAVGDLTRRAPGPAGPAGEPPAGSTRAGRPGAGRSIPPIAPRSRALPWKDAPRALEPGGVPGGALLGSFPGDRNARGRGDPLPIFVVETARDAIAGEGRHELHEIVVNLLVGEYCADHGQEFLVVQDLVEVAVRPDALSGAEVIEECRETLERLGRGGDSGRLPVGWHTTQPGLGTSATPVHREAHEACFGHPWQVLCLSDPCDRTIRFHRSEVGRLVPAGAWLIRAGGPP